MKQSWKLIRDDIDKHVWKIYDIRTDGKPGACAAVVFIDTFPPTIRDEILNRNGLQHILRLELLDE